MSFDISKAFATLTPKQETASKVTARLQNEVEGVCPYCGQPMTSSHAAGVPVWVCSSDRAVTPKANDFALQLNPTL